MLAQEIGHKYAHALFMSAKHKKMLELADEQFLALKAILSQDRSLQSFLDAPQVPDDKKEALIRKVFEGRMERMFVEFLLVLLDKHRINYLPEIIDEFDRLVKAEKGIARVTVITAMPLSTAEAQSLIARLAVRSGMTIELEQKIDPAILGGTIVIMHNQIIDGSLRHGLDRIREQLEKVKVA
ncbi:MAG: ATP synthase F1 subunit delta [Candidatus Zixiibacteriota bacterium]